MKRFGNLLLKLMSGKSDRVLRDVPRINYRELDESSLEEEPTLPALHVVVPLAEDVSLASTHTSLDAELLNSISRLSITSINEPAVLNNHSSAECLVNAEQGSVSLIPGTYCSSAESNIVNVSPSSVSALSITSVNEPAVLNNHSSAERLVNAEQGSVSLIPGTYCYSAESNIVNALPSSVPDSSSTCSFQRVFSTCVFSIRCCCWIKYLFFC